jgi:hypothetical protein
MYRDGVPIKSAGKSKINWTQIIALAAMVLSYVGFDLDVEAQAGVVTAIMAVQAVVTMLFRTFANRTVTPE